MVWVRMRWQIHCNAVTLISAEALSMYLVMAALSQKQIPGQEFGERINQMWKIL